MKRTLIYILLLANIFSGLAFAWDNHPEAVVGHDAVIVDLLLGGDYDRPAGGLHHGDHCCHGAAHLIGILYEAATRVTVGSRSPLYPPIFTSSFLYIAPLLRPPIV